MHTADRPCGAFRLCADKPLAGSSSSAASAALVVSLLAAAFTIASAYRASLLLLLLPLAPLHLKLRPQRLLSQTASLCFLGGLCC
jgi:hypothetical protein